MEVNTYCTCKHTKVKDRSLPCLKCGKEFSPASRHASHAAKVLAQQRREKGILGAHMKNMRKDLDLTEQAAIAGKALAIKNTNPEWRAQVNKNISDAHLISERAAKQRSERSRKGGRACWANPETAAKLREKFRVRKYNGYHYHYNGNIFRSSYEVRFAYILDKLNIAWEFEPRYYTAVVDGKERKYLPDFNLIDLGVWIQITGQKDVEKSRKIVEIDKQNNLKTIEIVGSEELNSWGFNNRFIKFTKDPLNSKIRYTNTEPSERRNSLEGVETRIESLKEEFLNKISIFHEPLPALSKS